MTIQIRTIQIQKFKFLKKSVKDYVSKSNINLKKKNVCRPYLNLQATFSFLQSFKYFLRYCKITKNNYVFYFI